MVRTLGKKKRHTVIEESAEIKKIANTLLDEQLDKNTPEVNKEDIINLLVKIANQLEAVTRRAIPDRKGGR